MCFTNDRRQYWPELLSLTMPGDALRYRSVRRQVHAIKGESKRKGGLPLEFGLSYIAVSLSLLQEMLATCTGGRPVREAKGEGGGIIGGSLVDIDADFTVEHDYQAGQRAVRL